MLMTKGSCQPVTRSPAEAGLAYEDVTFTASDGVELRGWFTPAQPGSDVPAPTVVFVHGWLWNRLGNESGLVPFIDRDVDFLPASQALHEAGYNVLHFDLSNHGESGSRFPITYGPWEARDYIGAVAYLRTRADVDPDRIGAVGTSMGGNAVLIGSPYCLPIKAVLLVQPSKPYVFSSRFAADQFGRIGATSLPALDLSYTLVRAPRPSTIDPGASAARLTDTMQKYVQGTGDQWGTMEVVEAFVAAAPRVLPLVRYPSTERYGGYRYVNEQADDVAAFFQEYL